MRRNIAVVVAGVAGVVASLAVGLPALRLRGLYLAVTSLAFVVATTSYVLNPRFFDWLPSGRIERFPIAGRIDWTSSFAMYHVSLVAMALTFVAVAGIRSSRTGRVLIAMRENESAAEAYGVDATRAKLTAFSISGFIAAAAGALIVHHQGPVLDGRWIGQGRETGDGWWYVLDGQCRRGRRVVSPVVVVEQCANEECQGDRREDQQNAESIEKGQHTGSKCLAC